MLFSRGDCVSMSINFVCENFYLIERARQIGVTGWPMTRNEVSTLIRILFEQESILATIISAGLLRNKA